jgi:hypothetical protein
MSTTKLARLAELLATTTGADHDAIAAEAAKVAESMKPYTFDVMSPSGYNDSPITVMATDWIEAAELAAHLVETERHETVLDVQDHIIVIPDE